VDSTFALNFSEDYLMYRNDIDGNGIYHIWFCTLPNSSIATSIVKVGTYEIPPPPVLDIPYEANLVNRYNYENVVVDEITNKISEITSSFNAAFSLTSTTDATRPMLNLANKRIEFNFQLWENSKY